MVDAIPLVNIMSHVPFLSCIEPLSSTPVHRAISSCCFLANLPNCHSLMRSLPANKRKAGIYRLTIDPEMVTYGSSFLILTSAFPSFIRQVLFLSIATRTE